jgi:hypothetical protein
VEGFFPLKREPLILAALFLLSNPSSFILKIRTFFFLTCASKLFLPKTGKASNFF